MPTPYHQQNLAIVRNRYRLGEAAAAGLMISVRCLLCRRKGVVFLASDLLQVFDRDRDAYEPPFPCSGCRTGDYVEVKLRAPDDAAVGKLVIRRLVGIRTTPIWRNETLGDHREPAPPPQTFTRTTDESQELRP